jgi:hypothetical protein
VLLVIIAGSAAILWPVVADQLGDSSARVESEVQTIHISLPATILGTDSLTLTSLQAMGILLFLVVGAVVVAGTLLSLAYVLLARQATALTESGKYSAHVAALEEKRAEKIKRLSTDRSVAAVPDHKMPRWSLISTSLIVLLFVLLFGMLVNGTFVPESEYVVGGRLVNSALPIAGGFVLAAFAFLLWRMRPKALERLETTDYEPIPWDSIWVIVSGLLVVGLGIGLLVYLNVPA